MSNTNYVLNAQLFCGDHYKNVAAISYNNLKIEINQIFNLSKVNYVAF